MAFAVSAVAVTILFLCLRRSIAFAIVSPVYVLVLVYGSLFPLAALLYDPEYGGGGVRALSTPSELIDISVQIYWILCAFIVGAILSAASSRRKDLLKVPWYRSAGILLSNAQAAGVLTLGFASIVLTVVGVGPETVWRRTEYLETQHVIGYFVAAALSVAMSFILGIAAAQRQKWAHVCAWVLQTINLVLMAALSTRRFALIPILFFFGATIAAPGRKAFRYALIGSVIAAPLLTEVPLRSRGMPEQGIATLIQIPAVIGEQKWPDEFKVIMNSVLISGPIVQISAEPLHDDIKSYLLTCINPLPGSMTDWVNMENRINLVTPYSAIGDLLRGGLLTALTYYFVLGAYFCQVEMRLRTQPKPSPGLLLVISFSYFFTIMSLQYSLRIVTRVVYYMILFDFAGRVIQAWKDRARSGINLPKQRSPA